MNRPKVEEFEFLEEYAETLEIYCDQLEKALDKACEELEKCEKILIKYMVPAMQK